MMTNAALNCADLNHHCCDLQTTWETEREMPCSCDRYSHRNRHSRRNPVSVRHKRGSRLPRPQTGAPLLVQYIWPFVLPFGHLRRI